MFSNIIICSVILLLFINITPSFADDDDPTLITLPYGQIKGQVLQNGNGRQYYAFQEIPYAAPPVGRLRFKEPAAPGRWYGILDTTKNTKICYQLNRPSPATGVVQTEDCLYLNVYSPANATEALPVLVWIHGGGYTYGDGTFQSYGPQFLIDYDIVVVAINYRLGPLGLLTTEDGVIPGNLGLKDQNFALQWVKENIELFGGDPEKVTIAGESAGGHSVGLHVISKRSAGLFRGGILESGTGIAPLFNPFGVPRNLAFGLGRTLDSNFTSEDSNELLSLLQTLPAVDITTAQISLPSTAAVGTPSWTPVIEDEELEGAFITGPMQEDIQNGNINQVPIIIGFNSEELLSFIANGYPNGIVGGGGLPSLKQQGVRYDNDLSNLVSVFNIAEEDRYTAGSEIRKIYTDGTFEDDVGALIRYSSDNGITTPAIRHAELQSNYTDVFLYQFSYNGPLGRQILLGDDPIDIEGVDPNGVGHAEEIWYLFDVGTNTDIDSFPARDRLVQTYVLSLWTNFVKYLNPTPTQDISLQNIIWSKVTPDSLNYLNINSTLSVQTDPKEYKKWKEIIDKYAIPPLVVY